MSKIDWNSKQRSDTIADDGTPNLSRDYRRVTDLSGYYLPDVDAELVSDELRQVWRNQHYSLCKALFKGYGICRIALYRG